MSIITEALEKAQKPNQKIGRSPVASIRGKRRPPLSAKRFVIALLIFSLIPSAYFLSQILINKELTVYEETRSSTGNVEALLAELDLALEEEAPPAPSQAAVSSPAVPDADVAETIKLTGIMYTPENPLAVINDSIWREGDSIGEVKILKIGKDFLKVDSSGRERTIKLVQ
jgi:hypothetical protein